MHLTNFKNYFLMNKVMFIITFLVVFGVSQTLSQTTEKPKVICPSNQMKFTSVVITGANRGIGLEFVKQLHALSPPPKYIIATTRQTVNVELDKLKQNNSSIHVLTLDTRKYEMYEQFVTQVKQIVGEHGVDLLINNAGVMIMDDIKNVTAMDMLENFEINSVAPLMLTKALLPLLKVSASSRKTSVVNISSRLGSITDVELFPGSFYPYRTSKAALNMISKLMAIDLKPSCISVIPINPGWVQTDLGGPKANMTATTSISNMINTIRNINDSVNGKLVNYNGVVIPY